MTPRPMPPLRLAALLAGALAIGAAGGCSGARDGGDPRDALLLEFFHRDNQAWRSRDPLLLEHKYDKMAVDPYNFMRGTAGLFYADVARTGAPRDETAFLSDAGAATILLIGDPHPENFGTVLVGEPPGPVDEAAAAGAVSFEWLDLDGATFGPYLLDVRRAAVGMMFLIQPLGGIGAPELRAVADALATGYADEIALRAAGETGWDPVTAGDTCGPWLVDLVDEAIEEGVERKKLFKYADPGEDGELRFVLSEDFDAAHEAWFAPTDDERAQLERLLEAYAPHAPEGFRLVDAARKYGSGVASLPAVRYRLIWDRGEDGFADDSLLQLREVVDAPAAPGLQHPVPGLFEDNAARLALTPRILWSSGEDGDRLLAGLRDGTQAFKATGMSSWFQDIEHEKIGEAWGDGDIGAGEMVCLAEALGRSVAAAHARSVTPDGEPALPLVAAELAGREVEFAAEIERDAEGDLLRTLDDHERFRRLLERHGPLLGIETLPEDVPR